MDQNITKLNLGAAGFKKEGYINVDWLSLVKPDVEHDLNKYPYPFKDNSFELIEASHVMEHLDRPFEVMKEVHRMLKPGGRIIIKVPHFSRGFTHSEHFHGFDVNFYMYFDKRYIQNGYFGVDFKLIRRELHWMAFFYLMSILGYGKLTIFCLRILNSIISFFANLSPNLCSRIWCFWVGGFEELEFELEVVK